MSLAAAHAFLQIVMSFLEGVFNNGHQRVVEFRNQIVAGGQKNLSLIGLGSGLIKSLAQVLAIEADEIDDGLRCNTNGLALLQIEREAGISWKLTLPQHNVIHAYAPIR